jgi:hypothetical protein
MGALIELDHGFAERHNVQVVEGGGAWLHVNKGQQWVR